MSFIEFLKRWYSTADEILVNFLYGVFDENLLEEDDTFPAIVYDGRAKELCSFSLKIDKKILQYLKEIAGSIQSIKGVYTNLRSDYALGLALELFYAYCRFKEKQDGENSIEEMWNFDSFREFWEGHAGTLIPKIEKIKFKNDKGPSEFVFYLEPPTRSLQEQFNEAVAKHNIEAYHEFKTWRRDGRPFHFNKRQSIALAYLAEAYLNKSGSVRGTEICGLEYQPYKNSTHTANIAGSNRIRDLFRSVPDWKKIVRMARRGWYELNIPQAD